MSALAQAIELLSYLDESELSAFASRVVLAVGMTPAVHIAVPEAADGGSWLPCWQRGVERIATATAEE